MNALEVISGKSNDKGNYNMKYGDTDNDSKSYLAFMKAADGQEISKQVYELVNLLSTSGIGSGLSSAEQKHVNMSLKNCVRHSDLEQEMLNNVRYKNDLHFTRIKGYCTSFETTNRSMLKINEPTGRFGGPRYVKFSSNFGMRDNMLTTCSPKPFRHSTRDSTKYSRASVSKIYSESEMLPFKEQKAYLHKLPKNSSRTFPVSNNEDKEINSKFYPSNNFSGEVFRKSLQKVVADVLGKSKVNSPRKNIISKPKNFVKRVINGSGEQCTRAGFNSPSYYLPPRAFGCGPSQYMKETSSVQDYDYMRSDHSQRHLKTLLAGREHDPNSSRTLPPFWSKPIISSKSDGDIQTSESSKKVGGSQENIKRKIEISPFGIKPFARRPHVARKKSVFIDKNGKVFL